VALCGFLWVKNVEAKDIHKEMLTVWAKYFVIELFGHVAAK
jgi:hypothetical protein